MAEFKFACPSCKQNIICDELWCGQQIQCPSCQAQISVPSQQAASPASSLVPPPPPPGSAPKLSLGRHQAAASSGPEPTKKFIPGTQPLPPPPKRKSTLLPNLVKALVVLIILGVGGYFGYSYWQKHREKAAAEAAAAAQPAPAPAASTPKPPPMVPPSYTLDVAAAKIPEGQANGSFAGTNFIVQTASIAKVGAAQVLALRDGTGASADHEIMLYLHLNPGETLAGRTWTISQEMKGATVPQVLKRWKPGPGLPPQQKFFSTGYAMKLELGQATDGTIPGKIFLALPDTEQSVVAGTFKLPPAGTEQPAQAVAGQGDAPAPHTGPDPSFEKRYGVRKK